VSRLKCVTVLLTCTGGVISPSQISCLRNNPEGRKLRIVATDASIPCVGQFLADKFYQVPFGTSPHYLERMLAICEQESVEVVFPASHEEALVLSKNREAFTKIGTLIAASRFEVLQESFNKLLAFNKLKDFGLPCAEFRGVRSLHEFESAATALGIERRKVVMKPVLTRGGRGARILTKERLVHTLLSEKAGYLEANYSEVKRMLSQLELADFPELILMEYLPGKIYSVDFLARDGKALIIVPKVRVVGNSSQTIVGVVSRNSVVEEAVERISEVFGFDYNVNIEMGSRDDGTVLPFDFNPRLGASVAFCSAAGANLIYFALKMALGEEVPKVRVKDNVMMLRHFKEIYVDA
jgi:carbamoyl-phosphate synthase large subunit